MTRKSIYTNAPSKKKDFAFSGISSLIQSFYTPKEPTIFYLNRKVFLYNALDQHIEQEHIYIYQN